MTVTAIMIIATHLLGMMFIKRDRFTFNLIISIGIIGGYFLLKLVVVYFYWKGRNWARWVVLVIESLAILGLLSRRNPSRPPMLELFDAALGMFIIYWLNTKNVRAYFSNSN